MRGRLEPARHLGVFLLRNLLLYFLLLHAWLYFRADLSLMALSAGFLVAVLLGVVLERLALRLWAAAVLFALTAVGARLLAFALFGLLRRIAPGPESDFLYFVFDKFFLPGLLPWSVAALFNFLFLRYPPFVFVEVGLDALLLLAVFWAQGQYDIGLYPHPSHLAYAVFGFLVLEVLLVVLARGSGAVAWRRELRGALSFLWVIVPLLALLLLFVLGRYSEGAVRQGGGLLKPTLFRFDFSQFIRLESEIRMSDDLVLLFRTPGPPASGREILLRRYVLSGYEPRRGFFLSRRADGLPTTVPDAPESLPDPGYLGRTEVSQEYFFVNLDPSSLIGLNYPVRVVPLANWDDSSFLRIYRVASRACTAAPEELRQVAQAGEGLSAEELRFYTDYGGDARIRALAEEITGSGAEAGSQARLPPFEAALRIVEHLKDNYLYSLRPGIAADGDQLAHFLYVSRKGYCSYFAFAMALLCRSLGIPARVAVGFYVDPRSEVLNFYEVRAYQAHAWVEVHLGAYGWVDFDPSSETIAPGEEDTIRFSFDFERLARLLEEILRNQHLLDREPPASAALPTAQRIRLLGRELSRILLALLHSWYLVLPGLYLLAVALVKLRPFMLATVLAWVSASLRAFAPASAAALGGAERRARRRVRYLFADTSLRLRGLGLLRRGEESHLEFARALEQSRALQLQAWTESYLQAVFAESFGQQALQEALARCESFRRSWRRSFPLPLRVLGFLNPAGGLLAARGGK
jgi:transglutaminase-like putative cysteine protease